MEILNKMHFGIVKEKLPHGMWSFGICLSHCDVETYIYINFFKWNICIGKLINWKAYETNEELKAEWTY